ncbi:high mobility group [Coemansia erecta]|nr:high mobility group [Coemansia erecta]
MPEQPACMEPAINALVREGEAIAAMAYRIGQHFQRYTQLLADLQQPPAGTRQHIHGAGSDTTLAPSDPGHCCDRLPPLAHSGTQNAGTHALFADAKPATKRPLSDFNFFCRDARKLVVEVHPEYTKEQVNKELGRIWSMLDGQSRQYYRSLYVQDKQRYSQDVASLAHKPGSPSQAQKQSRVMHLNNSTTMLAATGQPGGTLLETHRFSASDDARQTIWRCITAPPSSNTIQSILNDTLSPEASERTEESEDMDEPLASVVLRDHALTMRAGIRTDGAMSGYHWAG